MPSAPSFNPELTPKDGQPAVRKWIVSGHTSGPYSYQTIVDGKLLDLTINGDLSKPNLLGSVGYKTYDAWRKEYFALEDVTLDDGEKIQEAKNNLQARWAISLGWGIQSGLLRFFLGPDEVKCVIDSLESSGNSVVNLGPSPAFLYKDFESRKNVELEVNGVVVSAGGLWEIMSVGGVCTPAKDGNPAILSGKWDRASEGLPKWMKEVSVMTTVEWPVPTVAPADNFQPGITGGLTGGGISVWIENSPQPGPVDDSRLSALEARVGVIEATLRSLVSR